MNYIAPLSMDETVHNLINLHLFPDCALRLGQTDHRDFNTAKVGWTRIGNPHQYGFNALTYRYRISGDGFVLHLLATWADHDEATARVRVVDLHGSEEAARAWLDQAICDWRPVPSSLGLDLH